MDAAISAAFYQIAMFLLENTGTALTPPENK